MVKKEITIDCYLWGGGGGIEWKRVWGDILHLQRGLGYTGACIC